MSTQLTNPTIMEVSAFSNLNMKLRYLTGIIRTKEESENVQVSIECFKEFDEANREKSIIRISIDGEGWFDIYPLKKYGGDILDKSISVNLYDFFNVLDNCRDEMLSFRIDEASNSLIINSFYNEQLDVDELEVHLPIKNTWDGCKQRIKPIGDPTHCIKLSNLTMFTAMKELNIENKVKMLDFIFDDGKLSFQSVFNGVYSKITMKEMEGFDFGDIKNFSIPFNLFYLMSSTGQVSDLSLDIYDDYVWVNADCYSFRYKLNLYPEKIDFNIASEPVFIMNTEDGFTLIDKINKMNATENPTIVEYEKIEDGVADLVSKVEGRLTVYVRAVLATLKEDKIVFDGNLFYDIFSKSGVDAISVNKVNEDTLFIKYENAYMHKVVVYYHNQFIDYRKSLIGI